MAEIGHNEQKKRENDKMDDTSSQALSLNNNLPNFTMKTEALVPYETSINF